MPTYRNDGNQGHMVENADGARVVVAPGDTVETHRIYDLTGLTKTADTPRWNPVAATEEIETVEAGDVEVEIADGAKNISIINKSTADVNVYWDSAGNVPATIVPGSTVRTFSGIDGLAEKIICRLAEAMPAGNLFVIQSR